MTEFIWGMFGLFGMICFAVMIVMLGGIAVCGRPF